jgi:hypothetical protein
VSESDDVDSTGLTVGSKGDKVVRKKRRVPAIESRLRYGFQGAH